MRIDQCAFWEAVYFSILLLITNRFGLDAGTRIHLGMCVLTIICANINTIYAIKMKDEDYKALILIGGIEIIIYSALLAIAICADCSLFTAILGLLCAISLMIWLLGFVCKICKRIYVALTDF